MNSHHQPAGSKEVPGVVQHPIFHIPTNTENQTPYFFTRAKPIPPPPLLILRGVTSFDMDLLVMHACHTLQRALIAPRTDNY